MMLQPKEIEALEQCIKHKNILTVKDYKFIRKLNTWRGMYRMNLAELSKGQHDYLMGICRKYKIYYPEAA